jgi:uncharacterized protein
MHVSALLPQIRGRVLASQRLAICAALGLTLASLLVATRAQAQSFSCAHSQSQAQMAICNSEDLLVLDEKLSAMVAQRLARAKTLSERETLQREQSAWTGQRNACGSDQACLQRSYGERIVRLSGAAELANLARIPVARP